MKSKLLYILLSFYFIMSVNFAQVPVTPGDTVSTKSEQPTSPAETKTATGIESSEKKSAVKTDTTVTEKSSSLQEEFTPPVNITDIITVGKVFWSIVFFLTGFYLIKLITILLNKLSERSTKYRIMLKGLIPIMRTLGWTFLFLLIVIGIFRPPVETILLVAGSLGLAVGFAAQDLLKNIFGGITIIFDRPFQVGDKIQVGAFYGEVTNIGLRSTRIVTADDSLISLPNGEIMAQSISNSNTGETNCQVVAELYLPAYIDTDRARHIAIRCAQVSKYVYLNKPIAVIFKNELFENRSMLKMRLKAYVLDIRFEFAFMSDMTERTLKEFLKEGIVTKEDLNGIAMHHEKSF